MVAATSVARQPIDQLTLAKSKQLLYPVFIVSLYILDILPSGA
jgi:hypothetical protein